MSRSDNAQEFNNDGPTSAGEAEMIRNSARNFAHNESPLPVVRAAEAGNWTAARNSWTKLAALGWLELLQDEDAETEGLIAACIIAEELGRVAYPMPFAETAVLALPLLANFAANKVDIEAINRGAQKIAFALPLAGLPISADRLPRLAETPTLIANQLQDADLVLVPVQNNGQPALALAKRPDNGWHTTAMPDLANNSYSRVSIEDLKQAELIPLTWQAFARVFDNFRLVTAAYIVGLASQATDLAVDYAGERIAFGKPIGSFQAVQQRLAESGNSRGSFPDTGSLR
ncbi:MAG: acyl-CoA/acyl-ACP dehydrogenase [Alphaproteobacteria bacterium]|nr:acyl-CoA/acyl-ACP dehydrogenase [Alphaproteobacteria bacterium]